MDEKRLEDIEERLEQIDLQLTMLQLTVDQLSSSLKNIDITISKKLDQQIASSQLVKDKINEMLTESLNLQTQKIRKELLDIADQI